MATKLTTPDWMKFPPQTFEEKLHLLEIKKHLINDRTIYGQFLRNILRDIRAEQSLQEEQARRIQPFQFCKPSFEQSLVLNAWMYGVAFIGIYCCNRMGKTAVLWWNFLLWILPNNPKWRIFRKYVVGDPHDDPENSHIPNKGKVVQVFPRPRLQELAKIRKALANRPSTLPTPDPNLPHYHEQNLPTLQWLQKTVPSAFKQAWPNPPWDQNGTIWYIGPDHDHFKNILMPLAVEWLPSSALTKYTESDKTMTITVQPVDLLTHYQVDQSVAQITIPPSVSQKIKRQNETPRIWKFIGKSVDENTKSIKFASGAVDAILITEGLPPDKWKEIKARFKDPSIGSHDFTPFEPTNSGASSSLARKIYRGTEAIPIPAHIFKGWSVHQAPRHIISEEKYKGLVDTYKNDAEATARLDGEFYSSSALVLSNFDKSLHFLPLTFAECRHKFPNAQIYRGIDPGLDHPTAAAWALLLPTNQWIVYRFLSEQGLGITQRCEQVIKLSHNSREKIRFGPHPQDYYWREVHPSPKSEPAVLTAIDWHTFKEDEVTGQSFALNYTLNGLIVTESTHMGPEDRASKLNDLLRPSEFLPHPLTHKPPAPHIFFLNKEPGILDATLKWEEFYWDRKRSGEDRGQPKDKVPIHGDDELDALCYIVCGPYKWTRVRTPLIMPRDNEPEQHLMGMAKIGQRRLRGPQTTASSSGLQSLQNQTPVMFGQMETDHNEYQDNERSIRLL